MNNANEERKMNRACRMRVKISQQYERSGKGEGAEGFVGEGGGQGGR